MISCHFNIFCHSFSLYRLIWSCCHLFPFPLVHVEALLLFSICCYRILPSIYNQIHFPITWTWEASWSLRVTLFHSCLLSFPFIRPHLQNASMSFPPQGLWAASIGSLWSVLGMSPPQSPTLTFCRDGVILCSSSVILKEWSRAYSWHCLCSLF